MLSYRHAFHAGNHADVLKHFVLMQVIDHTTQKDKPFWYIDTHAGAGQYSLDAGYATQNAEYESAKEKQSFIEGRIAEIEAKLSNAMIIDPKTLNAEGRCVFGATVEVEDLDAGDKATYQIVGDDEADIKSGKISISSPIARALIGKSEGDVAEVVAPSGIRSYEVLNVQYI